MNIEQFPITPILDQAPQQISIYEEIGYFSGNVILPVAMILYVVLYFRNDKNIYLYAILMTLLFFTVPVWFLLVVGLVLIGLDKVSKWAKERKETSTFVDLEN